MKIVRFADRDFLSTSLIRSHQGYRLQKDIDPSPNGALIRHPKRRFFDVASSPTKTLLIRDAAGSFPTTLKDEIHSLARESIQEIVDQCPVDSLWLALPAVRDSQRRLLYRDVLTSAASNVRESLELRFYFEADAVVQYFRLVRGEIDTSTDELQAYLVVDAGAGTTNIAVTFKPRTLAASLGTEGRSRGPLQPVAADAPSPAGAWVDERLKNLLLERLPEGADISIEAIESAKLSVSRTGNPASVRSMSGPASEAIQLTTQDLANVVEDYWDHLAPVLTEVLAAVYKQLSESSRYRDDLVLRGISAPEQVGALFDYVILAGGTSLLPSFELGLTRLLPGLRARILRVDNDYPLVVAAGLAAHHLELAASAKPTSKPPARGSRSSSDWTHRVESSRVAGVARLLNDVAVIYQGKAPQPENSTLLLQTAFRSRDFPLGYEETVRNVWELPKKIPHAAHFMVAAAYVAEKSPRKMHPSDLRPEDFFVRADTEDNRWKRLKSRLPHRTLVESEYDENTLSLIVRLQRQSDSASSEAPIDTFEMFLDSPEDARLRARERLDRWVATRRPTDPVTVCVDFGTSKTVAVIAVPSFELEGVTNEHADGKDKGVGGPSSGPEASSKQDEPLHSELPALSLSPDAPKKTATRANSQPPRSAPGSQDTEDVDFDALVGLLDTDESRHHDTSPLDLDEGSLLADIYRQMQTVGLVVTWPDVVNIYLSLKVGPLVAFAGPPGMGKSSIARYFLQALGLSEVDGTLARVAVEARWTDSSHLMSGGDVAPRRIGDFARIAYRSTRRRSELFGVILDEWNLAHVDYYLSHVISALSDDGNLPLANAPGGRIRDVPLRAPSHRLLIVATMNVDEAATMLTEKVLDRTSVIELYPSRAPESLPTALRTPTNSSIQSISANEWLRMCALPENLVLPSSIRSLWEVLAGTIEGMSTLSPSSSYSLGFRAARDIAAYIYFAERLLQGPNFAELPSAWALDRQVLQRVLPRLHGDDRLRPTLERLRGFCAKENLVASLERVDRMMRTLELEHSTSFWAS